MAKKDIPSRAQAMRLASTWTNIKSERKVLVRWNRPDPLYREPTTEICIKRGWLVPVGEESHEHANGTFWQSYTVSEAGFDAVEQYLRERRWQLQRKAA